MHDAVRVYLETSGLSGKLREWPVYEAWSSVLGAELAQHAQPVRFQRGELYVEVDSAAHLHELKNFTAEHYRALANQRLGTASIRRVVLKLKR